MKTASDKQLKNETHWNWFRIACLGTKNDDCQSPATSDLQAASYLNLEVKWWASNDTSVILNTYVYNLNKRVEKFTAVIRSDKVRRSDVPANSCFVIWWFCFYFSSAIRRETPLLGRVENEVNAANSCIPHRPSFLENNMHLFL